MKSDAALAALNSNYRWRERERERERYLLQSPEVSQGSDMEPEPHIKVSVADVGR